MNELRREQLASSTEVLTKAQQDKFAKMNGKAFDLTQIYQLHGRHTRQDQRRQVHLNGGSSRRFSDHTNAGADSRVEEGPKS